jgi:hypothetical protein
MRIEIEALNKAIEFPYLYRSSTISGGAREIHVSEGRERGVSL